MSFWSRIVNAIHPDRLSREIDEELAAHLQEAVEQGRDPEEVRKAFGSTLLRREQSRDIRLSTWLDALRADAVFGWRQLYKRKITSAAAILSLALAIGSCTSAFRLIDALLLRPLPVQSPDRLYAVFRQGVDSDGKGRISDSYEYPLYRQMRAEVREQAELLAVSYVDWADLAYGSEQQMEKAHLQYVSGAMFGSFGLRPALGRLLTDNDDREPGAHPYAVFSYDYWTRRFGNDPNVLGRTFQTGGVLYQIVGVAGPPFTGTEPGTVTDIFLPTMMHAGVTHPDWAWFRMLAQLKPDAVAAPVLQKMRAIFRVSQQERAKGFTGRPKQFVERFLQEALLLEPAVAGLSDMQKDYRLSLVALATLVVLVLLIDCANIANLMAAQAAARAREMALRVSIGAGRWRLVQLVLVESALLAILAAGAGAWLAWWSAPFVVSLINPSDNPARLSLPADWRVLLCGLALTAGVTLLFGLAPALRASAVKPSAALKGGDDPRSRHRTMHAWIAAQVAFSVLVLFVAGLFMATFERLASHPTGFAADHLLTLQVVSQRPQPPVSWSQVADHLRTLPGVENVGLATLPLLNGTGMWGAVSVGGAPPNELLSYFLDVSPGWADTMRIPILDGRDFRPADVSPGVAIVNQAFARQYFRGENPVGKVFEKVEPEGRRSRFQVVGLIRDALYRSVREPMLPVAYLPFQSVDVKGAWQPRRSGTFLVRTSVPNPMALASALRREVSQARPEFRVSNIRTQSEINQSQTIRERLLATLALFFGGVALLLAGIGLYGALDYSVLQRRREIGIRMAIGAPAGHIALRVTAEVLAMVLLGVLAGLGLGTAAVRYIEVLLYRVKPTDFAILALPSLAICAAGLLAALPAVIRAVRTDPVATLRAE